MLCSQRTAIAACIAACIAATLASSALFISVPALAETDEAQEGYAARIHEGSCDNLGPVAHELGGTGAEETKDGTPVPAPEVVGSADAVPLAVSEAEVEASLSDLTEDDFAIALFESDETMIACGAIGGPLNMQMAGMVMPGDELAVGLAEVDESGHSGIALIRAEGQTATVRIFLAG